MNIIIPSDFISARVAFTASRRAQNSCRNFIVASNILLVRASV